ncbi:hypothetical protein D3H41_23565 [Vibrio neocaledonicus]|nr:hypothetical protein D3H41_23565 [Vibrio neocaledonicus]
MRSDIIFDSEKCKCSH